MEALKQTINTNNLINRKKKHQQFFDIKIKINKTTNKLQLNQIFVKYRIKEHKTAFFF